MVETDRRGAMTIPISLPEGLESVDATYVTARLEEAWKTLLCLRVHGTLPAGYRAAWPKIVQEIWDTLELEDAPFPVPSAAAITAMDQAFAWVALVGAGAVQTRRLIWLRLLVHPISERHSWSWRRLEKVFGLDHKTLKARHGRGIDRIAGRLNRPGSIEQPGEGLP